MERKYTVDIDSGNQVISDLKETITKTYSHNVISPWGSFAGCFDLSTLKEYNNPVLVSSVDSVGSKILLAKKYNSLNTIGYDLVNHCINDILVMGAKPLYFMDYIASSKLDKKEIKDLVTSVANCCKENDISLIGGETAEIKDMFSNNSVDLVGFIVGVVEKDKLITGDKIKEKDIVLALRSSGFHTNGYTLINQYADDDNKDELLKPHKSYLPYLNDKLDYVNGLIHLTGGGWVENPKRIIPKGLCIEVKDNLEIPKLFKWIQKETKMTNDEMFKTFNMGYGMLVIVSEDKLKYFDDNFIRIGEIKKSI
jgi:phosphoribosylformylglycinamidine cyclo-ligase